MRRSVEAAAGDLVHTNLPVAGVGRPGERHRHGGVGGEGGAGGVQIDVLSVVVAAYACWGMGGRGSEVNGVVEAAGVVWTVQHIWPSDHRVDELQSDVANIQAGLLEGVATGRRGGVGLGVGSVLDMC